MIRTTLETSRIQNRPFTLFAITVVAVLCHMVGWTQTLTTFQHPDRYYPNWRFDPDNIHLNLDYSVDVTSPDCTSVPLDLP